MFKHFSWKFYNHTLKAPDDELLSLQSTFDKVPDGWVAAGGMDAF